MSTTVYPQVYSEGVITPVTQTSHSSITEQNEIDKLLNFTPGTGNYCKVIKKNNIVEVSYKLTNLQIISDPVRIDLVDEMSGLVCTKEAIVGIIPEDFRPLSSSFTIYGQCICAGVSDNINTPTQSEFLNPAINYFTISDSGNIKLTLSGERYNSTSIKSTVINTVIIHAIYTV